MPDVFINYRTGDGEETATTLERDLSNRFGSRRIFRASKSIEPGALFDDELLTAVRRSSVLIAVVGGRWAGAPELRDPKDWVRKEILEALRCSLHVVPVLVGRRTERLRPDELPRALAKLARCQSVRYDTQDADAGLRRISAFLTDRVPELAEAEQALAQTRSRRRPDSVGNSAENVSGTVIQAGDVSGDVGGTVIKHVNGPVHTGTGPQHQPHLSGDGAQYIAGDNREGIHQSFGSRHRREDGSR
ncbi:TIR domain-containing protein [Streptomyces sp. SID10853]|uniref:toll/interleukin-1 receptor domain-containing protein n=1 Tax=Streptomyces sp. SID10853 TaxID=2706028 RepID=UPI0013C25EA4|nr:toll/interleukin-1 receptor domain-containing protein [Streptomyces sp. SID10853]NDZ80306.1 TIR domain-containing protein [Streptomyces sp. SID10853]